MLIRRLLPLLLLAAWLPAQDDRLSEREAAMEQRIRERAERAGKGTKGPERDESKEKDEQALENMTPEERLAHSVRSNASAFCKFVAAVKPAKLMPGQTGVIVVSALMSGQAVLPSPAPMEMIGSPQQGIATLGGLSFHPAEMGRQAAGYLGRPVYDNYAIFEVPVTVAPEATIGTKQPVSIDLRFDIYDGVSAQPIGRFVDRVTAELEVGRALDPAVQGGVRAPSPEESPASVPPSTAATGPIVTPADDTPQRPALAGRDPVVVEPDAVPAPEAIAPAERGSLPLPADSGDLPLPVWLGGGALVLVIVLMLARKR